MPSSERSSDQLRVFIADSHPPIREALRAQIATILDMTVCGEAGTTDEAFHQIQMLQPDVVVIELLFDDGHGLDLINNIQAQCPDVRILVFSRHDERVCAERAIRAGASGYLMKSTPTQTLIEAIRIVHRRNIYLSPRMTSQVLNKVARGETQEAQFPVDELTDRELSVFQLIGEGYVISEIEQHLNLARKTVETYRRRVKEKFGFDSVSQLTQHAVQWALASGTSNGFPSSFPPSPDARSSLQQQS